MFGFPFFAIFASRLSSILFTWSLHGLPRLLILAHLESRSLANSLRIPSPADGWPSFFLLLAGVWLMLVSSLFFQLFFKVITGLIQVLYILVLLFKLMHSPNYIA